MQKKLDERKSQADESNTMLLKLIGDRINAIFKPISGDEINSLFENEEGSIISTRLIPFFGDMRMNDITSKDVLQWQNEPLADSDINGNGLSQTYLRTINNQLTAIFNHAVRYYELQKIPARQALSIDDRKGPEMKFWTKEQYLRFPDAIMDKPESFTPSRFSTGADCALASFLRLRRAASTSSQRCSR